ncbi:MAG: 3-phosphoshikimate 1-carboxyvinyltransferase [Bacteroidia bacterium]|nr:3-phosphoshikimate 1-carboxyvinyltransferase [Bacteroidia bacterium]
MSNLKLLARADYVEGVVNAPPSKSEAQRYLVGALLANNQTSLLKNLGESTDVLAAQSAIQQLGASVISDNQIVTVLGAQHLAAPKQLFCGESGLGFRLLMPVVSLQPEPVMLTGIGTLLFRKQEGYRDALPESGVFFATSYGYPPVIVRGPMQGGKISLSGKFGSQYLSGLLFALPKAPQDSFLTVENPTSKPYIQLTLQILAQFGIHIEANEALTTFSIPGRQSYQGATATISGDWSGAAFLAAAAAINGHIQIAGLQANSYQADEKILTILQMMGAKVEWKDSILSIQSTGFLQGISTDLTHCPDLFPVIAMLACFAQSNSYLRGIKRLTNKESNRAAVIQAQFSKTGAAISLHSETDTMMISPAQTRPRVAVFRPENDHRIAMAAALAGFFLSQGAIIDQPHCVQKSFPDYWSVLQQIGFSTRTYS